MKLRRATSDDIARLEHWDEQPHVQACYGEDDGDWPWAEEIDRQDAYQEIFLGEVDGRPVGVVVIIDPANEPSHYWGDIEPGLRAIDIWLGEASDLNRGFGTRLMTLAIEHCFAVSSVHGIVIDPLLSNVDALRFYKRLGFVEEGVRVFESEPCQVCRLSRAAWDQSAPKL